MLGQHVRHALARAFAPHGDDHALAGGLQPLDVFGHRVKDAGGGLVALGSEVVAGVHAGVDGVRSAFGRGERRQAGEGGIVEPFAPFGFGEIKPVRRQWFVRRAATRLVERVLARLIIVGDLRKPFVRGFFRQRLDCDRSYLRHSRTAFQAGCASSGSQCSIPAARRPSLTAS